MPEKNGPAGAHEWSMYLASLGYPINVVDKWDFQAEQVYKWYQAHSANEHDPVKLRASVQQFKQRMQAEPSRPIGSSTAPTSSRPAPQADATPAQIKLQQNKLRAAGYNIAADGVWGPQTQSATNDYALGAGKRNPNKWNQGPKTGIVASGRPAAATAPASRAAASSRSDRTTPAGGASDLSSMYDNIPTNVNGFIPVSQANNGAQLTPESRAGELATQQFSSAIAEAHRQIAKQPLQAAQDMRDISNWYGQVMNTVGQAGANVAAQGQQTAQSLGDSTKSIISSLGGAANQGSGMVAASGQAGQALSANIGQIDQSFLEQMKPLLAAEGAGASSREQARQAALAQDMAAKLQGLESDRGARQSELQLQIEQGNNAIRDNRAQSALQIRQYNNTLAQQNITNAMTLAQTKIAGIATGANVNYTNAQTTALKENGKFTPWNKLNPQQQQYVMQEAYRGIADSTGALIVSPEKAWQIFNRTMIGHQFSPQRATARAQFSVLLTHAQATRAQQEAARSANGDPSLPLG